MNMTEWHPRFPDWSKGTRCTECRIPPEKQKILQGRNYVEVTCRTCKFVKISICSDCGEEMGLCTANKPQYNCPPDKEWHLDKKRKCVKHEQRV